MRHLFRRHVTGGPDPEHTCLTCPGRQVFGTSSCVSSLTCEWAEVILSPANTAYLLHCLGPGVPSSHVFSLPDNKVWTVSIPPSSSHLPFCFSV